MHGLAVAGDDELLVAARIGDQACFEQLIRPHIAVGYRLAASMLNDSGQAEDVVQESILRAWHAVGRLRPGSQIRPWFLTIVANRSRSLRRSRWWSVLRVAQPEAVQPSPAEAGDRHTDLVRALRRLRPEERAAVCLRFYEDMNSREVGEALGISAAGARSRIRRGLRRMRIDLAEEEL